MTLSFFKDLRNTTVNNNSALLSTVKFHLYNVNEYARAMRELFACICSCFTPQGGKGTVDRTAGITKGAINGNR